MLLAKISHFTKLVFETLTYYVKFSTFFTFLQNSCLKLVGIYGSCRNISQKYFGIFGIGDNIEEVLGQNVKGIRTI